MANSTAMQTNLFNSDPMLSQVSGHKVPIVDGIAWVLNADVAAAQVFGWTVLSNQPNVSEPTLMRPPPEFLMGNPWHQGPLEGQFPDGTTMSFQDAPFRNVNNDQAGTERNCAVPAQWVEWAKAAWGWRPAPSPHGHF